MELEDGNYVRYGELPQFIILKKIEDGKYMDGEGVIPFTPRTLEFCILHMTNGQKIEDGKYTKSSNENIIKFRDYLNDHGIVATIRRELGADINAACGQLRKQNLKQ